jgi:hypothetical protein
MITLFKTGLFDYSDLGIEKPVKFTLDDLKEIASRNAYSEITVEHTDEVIGTMGNFIVDGGLLKTDKPKDIDLKGMGLSPLFEIDTLIDMGDYYAPKGIKMPKIGYTKTPRTQILYNSVSNGEGNVMVDDTELRKALKRNEELQQEIGVYKSQIDQLKRSNKKYKKEIDEFQESDSSIAKLKEENEALKIKANALDTYIAGEKAELINDLAGDNKALAEEYENVPIEHLRLFKKNIHGGSAPRGVASNQTHVDDGNDVPPSDDEEDVYTDEMFEADFEASGL